MLPSDLAPMLIPPRGRLPVVLSIPHSGRAYSDELVARARRGRGALERLADPLVDRLAWRALGLGVAAVIARAPRAYVDCNRHEDELDPAAIAGPGVPHGPRARRGLGLIASRTLRDGPLWRRPIDAAALEERLAIAYRPYHGALAAALDACVARHGIALLLDLHSMPSLTPRGAQIVIGDRHGSSAGTGLAADAAALAEASGFTAACNTPYAGGEIIARHGEPSRGRHALQVEIDRNLYLHRDGATPGGGFERVAMLLERLVAGLGESLLPAQAAE